VAIRDRHEPAAPSSPGGTADAPRVRPNRRRPEHQLDAGYEAVEARIDAHAAAPRIALALAGLPSDERDVLLLHTWANLSYAEMADALEIPIGTVRSRL
jgi:RNA polymerase sigma factor (sigma-70 family)